MKDLSKSGSDFSNDFGNLQIQYNALKMGEKIGRGAAGEVFRFGILYPITFRGTFRSTDVAIKVLKQDNVVNFNLENFIAEAKLMKFEYSLVFIEN